MGIFCITKPFIQLYLGKRQLIHNNLFTHKYQYLALKATDLA